MSITLSNISKSFKKQTVLNNLNLTVRSGEFHVLLGPSGEGKSVLLNIIAGLMKQDQGNISFAGRDITNLTAEHRPIGYVFQDFALFPNMSVSQNIAFGLKSQGVTNSEAGVRVSHYVKLLGLDSVVDKKPFELSGGQKQRVAIARAMVLEPDVLLFDEPLSHLDSTLHQQLIYDLKQIHLKTGVTCLYVTHNRDEAMNLADQVSILRHGEIIQTDTPEEVYYRPKTKFVAKFVGAANVLDCQVLKHDKGRTIVKIVDDMLRKPMLLDLKYFPVFSKDPNVSICVHSEKIHLTDFPTGKNCFPVTVKNIHSMDSLIHLTLDVFGLNFLVKIPRSQFSFSSDQLFMSINDHSFYPLCGRCQRQIRQNQCEHYYPESKNINLQTANGNQHEEHHNYHNACAVSRM